jgi:hypothetical protein
LHLTRIFRAERGAAAEEAEARGSGGGSGCGWRRRQEAALAVRIRSDALRVQLGASAYSDATIANRN